MPARAALHLGNSSHLAQHYPHNNIMPNKEISESAKLYAALFKQVREKFDAEEFDECDRLALTLLTKADLPVIIRARCHMILGRLNDQKPGSIATDMFDSERIRTRHAREDGAEGLARPCRCSAGHPAEGKGARSCGERQIHRRRREDSRTG